MDDIIFSKMFGFPIRGREFFGGMVAQSGNKQKAQFELPRRTAGGRSARGMDEGFKSILKLDYFNVFA
jgi:hypothetical protein